MKTFVVIPAQYGSMYKFQAAKVQDLSQNGITFADAQDNICAVIPLANVVAVYEDQPKK